MSQVALPIVGPVSKMGTEEGVNVVDMDMRLLEIAEPTRFETYVAVKSGAPLSPYATHFIKTLRAEMEAVGRLKRRVPRR